MSHRKILLITFSFLFAGCVITTPSNPHSSATGCISGHVLDSHNRPVAGIEVCAIYVRGWTTFMPPAPNAFVVGTTRTGSHGQFRLTTSKRVDRLAARTDDFREIGELANVRTQDNVIHITKR